MDLRALRAFVEVVRQGGFTAAGRSVFATQSTISKAVRGLEEELGGPLLQRLPGRVHLTEIGEVVFRHALVMLTERENMLAEIAAHRGLLQGTLRLGLPPFGSSVLFAPLVAAFRSRYPDITIELREQGSRALQEAVLAGEIEMAMALRPVPDGLAWQGVRDEPLVALLPAGHRLVGRHSISLHELADSPFILYEAGFALAQVVENACRRRGFAPQEAARSGQTDFIVALVAAGLGVALLPRLIVEPRQPLSVAAVVLDDADLRWQAGLVWRADTEPSPAARAWLTMVAEATSRGAAASTPSAPAAAPAAPR